MSSNMIISTLSTLLVSNQKYDQSLLFMSRCLDLFRMNVSSNGLDENID